MLSTTVEPNESAPETLGDDYEPGDALSGRWRYVIPALKLTAVGAMVVLLTIAVGQSNYLAGWGAVVVSMFFGKFAG